MMFKPLYFSVAAGLLLGAVDALASVSVSDFEAEAKAISNATYVYTGDEKTMAKLALSYHNQLLATDKQDGFLVIQYDFH